MRLPLRHLPASDDAPLRGCAHLDALARALVGVPLGAAAERVSSRRSRGRYGAAVQWHLGLAPHDADARLDWEDRIEIKLVSVWARGDHEVGCDKVKVCDLAIDPWHKLGNVLWVFADRLTRVVVATRQTRMAGDVRARLADAWTEDPHFGQPALFVEAREQAGRSAPAYYLAASWFAAERLLPAPGPGILEFDARWWSEARTRAGGRDPWPSLATSDGEQRCRRCGEAIRFDAAAVRARGWAPAWHGLSAAPCGLRGHFAVDPARLLAPPPGGLQLDETLGMLEGLPGAAAIRTFERVPEPGDHGH
jgi:hypothetical protein